MATTTDAIRLDGLPPTSSAAYFASAAPHGILQRARPPALCSGASSPRATPGSCCSGAPSTCSTNARTLAASLLPSIVWRRSDLPSVAFFAMEASMAGKPASLPQAPRPPPQSCLSRRSSCARCPTQPPRSGWPTHSSTATGGSTAPSQASATSASSRRWPRRPTPKRRVRSSASARDART